MLIASLIPSAVSDWIMNSTMKEYSTFVFTHRKNNAKLPYLEHHISTGHLLVVLLHNECDNRIIAQTVIELVYKTVIGDNLLYVPKMMH